jgi:hypothetical protein
MNQNGANMVIGIFQVGDNNGFSDVSMCDPDTDTQAAAE